MTQISPTRTWIELKGGGRLYVEAGKFVTVVIAYEPPKLDNPKQTC